MLNLKFVTKHLAIGNIIFFLLTTQAVENETWFGSLIIALWIVITILSSVAALMYVREHS